MRTFLFIVLASLCHAADKPNLLWITAEDICPNLGCYGDPDAMTPNLDKFAAQSVRFLNCFSVHPCCSPSRSCLATGVYPTRLGTFQHRGKMWVNPDLLKCFPTLLRGAGYYTFNGSRGGGQKTDYNFTPKDQPWDKIGSKEIEWRHRAAGQPFFGQINIACTHQSQYGQRKAKTRTHDPAKVRVPPYHPDTPAVREIWAEYHDRVTQMDGEFAALLKMLDDDNLADNTIIFFFGDNGHGIPGGKVWLWDQGPHVPLIVHFPKKWKHHAPGSVSDRLVSFLDFAPTMLSLAGVEIPGHMQGVAFLGDKAGAPRRYVHAARDFHDSADFDTSRMVRDARFHYIRNFMPHIGWDAIQYSWEKAPFMLEEWRQFAEAGKLKPDTRQACFFRRTKPVEELYDMQTDPYQMRNLAGDPKHQETLGRMRAECLRWMLENRDLGLLSQYELYVRSEKDSPLEMGADPKRNPIRQLFVAANVTKLPQLCTVLKADDCAVRRWGAIGLLSLREKAAPATEALVAALKDSSPDVRMTAAEALCGLGWADDAMPVLIELLSHESRIIRNETLLAICRIGPAAKPTLPHLDKALPSCRHSGIWSHDNIAELIALARACMTGETLSLTRQKYYP
jgi:arylsulfatase A-like enzyme